MKKGLLSTTTIILLILIFAASIRFSTFTLPHDNGDQVFYLTLAMKLDQLGFSGYSLRNVDEKFNNQILGFFLSETQKGSMLKNLESAGVHYYDQPLFHRPYFFPYSLMLSHRIFSRNNPFFTLKTTYYNNQTHAKTFNAQTIWYLQLYAAFIPFLFSLLFIFTTFLLAKEFYTKKIALISAFLIAISPIDILSSQKIWADTMLSFLVTLSVLTYFISRKKLNSFVYFATGLIIGCSILVKQTGGFIVIAILIFSLFYEKKVSLNLSQFFKRILNKNNFLILLGIFVITLHWFASVYNIYGDPLFGPKPEHSAMEQEGWFMTISQRPAYLYLIAIPYLVPVFLLSYFVILLGPFIKGFIDEKKSFLIIWILTYFCLLSFIFNTRENRYMLPAYPAIAILSAVVLHNIGDFINKHFKTKLGGFIIVSILLFCAMWSVPIGVEHALRNQALILLPF